MDAQLKKVWVEALRSGEYKQGKGMLYRPEETHCCLGVLCKVAGKGSYSEGEVNLDGGYFWLDGIFPDGIRTFVNMNDHQGKSFNEIADYIEANL